MSSTSNKTVRFSMPLSSSGGHSCGCLNELNDEAAIKKMHMSKRKGGMIRNIKSFDDIPTFTKKTSRRDSAMRHSCPPAIDSAKNSRWESEPTSKDKAPCSPRTRSPSRSNSSRLANCSKNARRTMRGDNTPKLPTVETSTSSENKTSAKSSSSSSSRPTLGGRWASDRSLTSLKTTKKSIKTSTSSRCCLEHRPKLPHRQASQEVARVD